MKYSDKLKNPKWQKKRLEILQRDDFACVGCGDNETSLHIHHIKYTGEPWEALNEDLVTQCEHCHLLLNYNELIADGYTFKKSIHPDGTIVFYFKGPKGIAIYAKSPDEIGLNKRTVLSNDDLKMLFEFAKEKL